MDKIKVVLGGGSEEKDTASILDDGGDACKLSFKSRMIGFGVCCGIGVFLSFLVGFEMA